MSDGFNVADESKTPQGKALSYAAAKSDVVDFNDYASLYDAGRNILQVNGFYLVRSPVGTHCGHQVYVRSLPRPAEGIKYPAYFKMLRLIETEEDEALLSATFMAAKGSTTEIQQFWSPLTQPVSGAKSTPLQGYVDRLTRIDANAVAQNELQPHKLGIQIDGFSQGQESPRAFLPKREWFSPEVQKLKFADIFTLWPPAELEMLQLILGRIFVGRSGNKHVGSDKIIEHTFRSVAIIVGEDAGLGKSTQFEKFFKAINSVGYRRCNFRDVSERFGIGDVIDSDVAYKDDVTGATLANLIKSENTKIIASGGQLQVEDKFAKGYSMASKTVLIANTNEWNPRLVYSIDPGTVDRIKLLSTYRRAELQREAKLHCSAIASNSPDFAPFIHLPWLSHELGVDETTLMLWAARLSADEFTKYCYMRDETPTDALRNKVHDVSTRLRFSFNKDSTRALISAMLLSHILLSHLPIKRRGKQKYEMRELSQAILSQSLANLRSLVTDKNLFRLRSLIKMHWEQNGRPETHPWASIRKLNFATVRDAHVELGMQIASGSSLDALVKAVFSKIALRDGFAISSDIVWVTSAWEANKGYVDDAESLARAIDRIVDTHGDTGGQLCEVANTLATMGEGKAEDGWLDSTEYTPKSVELQLSEQSGGVDYSQFVTELLKAKWQN